MDTATVLSLAIAAAGVAVSIFSARMTVRVHAERRDADEEDRARQIASQIAVLETQSQAHSAELQRLRDHRHGLSDMVMANQRFYLEKLEEFRREIRSYFDERRHP